MRATGLRIAALLASTAALVSSLLAVYFTTDILKVPDNTQVATERLAHRVLLLVIDGLRYDTALETDLMPNLRRLAERGASGLSLAGEVTMSEIGVRTIGTGVSPGLADYLRLSHVDFDNPLSSLAARNGRIALVGSGTWNTQFNKYAHIRIPPDPRTPLRSFVDNVNGADGIYVEQALAVAGRDDWDLLVVHLPGLDTASHRWTAFTEPFRNKARAVDGDIARLRDAAGANTTFVITSDHGTSDRGHHGSGEPEARRTPIVLSGPGISPGVRLSIRQVDIAPTLSILLGVPIPAPSEGRVMLTALDISENARTRIAAANTAQLEHYAAAFAGAHGIRQPVLDPNNPHALGDWLDTIRSRNILVPMAWASSLLMGAVLLVVGRTQPSRYAAIPLWSMVILLAIAAIDSGARNLVIAGITLFVSIIAFWFEPRAKPGRGMLATVALLAMIELAVFKWRIHRRAVELVLLDLENIFHLDSEYLVAIAVALAIAVAVWPLRRMDPTKLGPWALLAILFALSAAGDNLALPVGIGAGVLAALVAIGRPQLPGALILIAAGIASIAIERLRFLDHSFVGAAGPLLCAALALARARLSRRALLLPLVAIAVGAAIVRAAGVPPVAYRALILFGSAALITLPMLESETAPSETFGWAALILLSVFCLPTQVPGLLACALIARESGRLVAAGGGSDDAIVLRATLFALAARLGFFALFERAFAFSKLELWLAFMGNSTDEAFGMIVIVLKFTLAYAVSLALVTADLQARARARVIGCSGAFLLLRVAHIVLSMTVAHGTFHSPNADAGPLLLDLAMAASVLLVGVTLALVQQGPRRRSTAA